MSQRIYIENNEPLDSFNTNVKEVGILEPGVYRGFDNGSFAGTNLTIDHSITGIEITEISGTTKTVSMGVVLTRQGSIVHEDASVVLPIDDNDGNAFTRTDYIVGDHLYQDSPGGVDMAYVVIKGPLGSTAEPSLTNPLSQVLIGKVVIQASALDHSASVYTREDRPGLGGTDISITSPNDTISIIEDGGNRDIDLKTPTIVVSDFNNEVTPGIYTLDPAGNGNNSPSGVIGGDNGVLIVTESTNGIIHQVVIGSVANTVNTRYKNTGGVWSSWAQLIRNIEYDSDISDINNDIAENTERITGLVSNLGDLTSNTSKQLIQASEHPVDLIVTTAYWHSISLGSHVKKLVINTPTGGLGQFIARVESNFTGQPWLGYKLIVEIVKVGTGSIGVIGVNASAFSGGSDAEAFFNAYGANNILISNDSGNYVSTNLSTDYFPPGTNTAYFEFNAAGAVFQGAHLILECVDNSVPQNPIWLLTWANRHTPIG